MQRKPGIYINVGNLLEPFGAVVFCVGIGGLAGVWWALVAAGILLVVAAEVVYAESMVRAVPLPRRWPPRVGLFARFARRRDVFRAWSLRRFAPVIRRRVRRADR